METEIILSGVTAALLTILAMIVINYINIRQNKRQELNASLKRILEISIAYPYLESEKFTKEWPHKKSGETEEILRYDLYCTLLFNYLADLSDFHKFKSEKIEAEIHLKPWVRSHANYWREPLVKYENVDGYDKRFRNLINSYLEN